MWKMKTKLQDSQRRVENLSEENKKLKEDNDKLTKILNGERVCDHYCRKCENSHSVEKYMMYGSKTEYHCLLDCKCKDFKMKDENNNK